ncbi:MAG: ABC transporter permease [Steroidobacteraceae bacterium]
MSLRNRLSQVLAVSRLNLQTLPARWQEALVTVIGIAGVVLVVVGVFSIAAGLRATLELSGANDVAFILRGGSSDELQSGVSLESARIVGDAPGVVRDAAGPLVSAELFVSADLRSKATGASSLVPLRGVGAQAPKLRSHFRMVAGRYLRPGTNELVVGAGAQNQFESLDLGRSLKLGTSTWQIVGVFSDAASVAESEIWADASVLQGAYNRGNSYQSIRARLTSPAAFRPFKDALTSDPRVNLRILTEREYYEFLSGSLRMIVRSVGVTIALLMGLGAVFGALNTMYSAVAARTREIATLRALGFSGFSVAASVLLESVLLGLAGALIGGTAAFLLFNGLQTSTLNFTSFTQVTFAFRVTPALLGWSVVYAFALALAGGLLPGIRAARLPVTSGLREL